MRFNQLCCYVFLTAAITFENPEVAVSLVMKGLFGYLALLYFIHYLYDREVLQYLISRRILWLSRSLSNHTLWSFILDPLFLGLMIYSYGQLFGTSWSMQAFAFGAIGPFLSRFLFTNKTIRILKKLVNGNFKIAIFRNFNDELHGHLVKANISPTFGAYGKVSQVIDRSFTTARDTANVDTGRILSDRGEIIALKDEDWKVHVEELIKNSNCCVFLWSNRISDAMKWEVATSFRHLEQQQVIFFILEKYKDQIYSLLEQEFSNARPYIICLPEEHLKKQKVVRGVVYEYFISLELNS